MVATVSADPPCMGKRAGLVNLFLGVRHHPAFPGDRARSMHKPLAGPRIAVFSRAIGQTGVRAQHERSAVRVATGRDRRVVFGNNGKALA